MILIFLPPLPAAAAVVYGRNGAGLTVRARVPQTSVCPARSVNLRPGITKPLFTSLRWLAASPPRQAEADGQATEANRLSPPGAQDQKESAAA
jgi:hypothetical protein